MKVKILKSSDWYRNSVGIEFEITEYDLSKEKKLNKE